MSVGLDPLPCYAAHRGHAGYVCVVDVGILDLQVVKKSVPSR